MLFRPTMLAAATGLALLAAAAPARADGWHGGGGPGWHGRGPGWRGGWHGGPGPYRPWVYAPPPAVYYAPPPPAYYAPPPGVSVNFGWP